MREGVTCRNGAEDEMKGVRTVGEWKPLHSILLELIASLQNNVCGLYFVFIRTLFLKQTETGEFVKGLISCK